MQTVFMVKTFFSWRSGTTGFRAHKNEPHTKAAAAGVSLYSHAPLTPGVPCLCMQKAFTLKLKYRRYQFKWQRNTFIVTSHDDRFMIGQRMELIIHWEGKINIFGVEGLEKMQTRPFMHVYASSYEGRIMLMLCIQHCSIIEWMHELIGRRPLVAICAAARGGAKVFH